MRHTPWIRTVILTVLFLLIGVAGFRILAAQKKPVPREKPRPVVMTALGQVVRFAAHSPQIEAGGRIKALESADLIPEVSARVLERPFRLREGTRFAQGDTLLKLDDELARNSMQSAISELMNALASVLPDLKTDWPQSAAPWIQFLADLKFDSLPPMPSTQGNEKLFLARNRVFSLYYNARNLELQWRKHALIAPFPGTVVSAQIAPGSYARAGVAVARVSRTDLVELELPLPAEQAQVLKPGQTIRVISSTLDTVAGTVDRLSGVLDERTQSRLTYIRMRYNPQIGLLPGAYASVSAQGVALPRAFPIPRAAALNGTVHLVRGGKLVPVTAQISALDNRFAYITAGISEGDTVLVQPVAEAVAGTSVQVQIAEN